MRLSKLHFNPEWTEVSVPYPKEGSSKRKEFDLWLSTLVPSVYLVKEISIASAAGGHITYDTITYKFRDSAKAAEFNSKFGKVDLPDLLKKRKWFDVRVKINTPHRPLVDCPLAHQAWLKSLPLDTWEYVGIGAEEYVVYQYYRIKNEGDATEFVLRFG